jgi:hypothetical protein
MGGMGGRFKTKLEAQRKKALEDLMNEKKRTVQVPNGAPGSRAFVRGALEGSARQ